MSEINLNCPDCGRKIKIKVKTVESLKLEIKSLIEQRDFYKRKLAALEIMNKNKSNYGSDNDVMGMFNEIFGGNK